jgi:N-acetylneuraminic acid mutarotase
MPEREDNSMKSSKSHFQIEQQHRFKHRLNRARQTAVLLVAAVCLTGLLPSPGYSQNQDSAFHPTTSSTPSGRWTFTGNLNTPRSAHTATLLVEGKVLVPGGYGFQELYDPATGAWSDTPGGLSLDRAAHTATLLQSGKVLVAGGAGDGVDLFGDSVPIATAELYDPATETWSRVGNLATARLGHTATLLPDGKVLVVGGYNGNGIPNDAELYDPETATWSVTGSRHVADFDHTATLLRNGSVLAVGGNRAELYDPHTGTWNNTASSRVARRKHTATLLADGRVLVASGEAGVSHTQTNSAEVYNPDTSTWSDAGTLSFSRWNHTATLLPSGKVLIVGGLNIVGRVGSILSRDELFDPETMTWSSLSSINAARTEHTATLLPNGKVMVAGGYNQDTILSSAEIYDPDSPVPIPTITGASVTGKRLFVFGEDFNPGAVILINGEEQITKNAVENPKTVLVGKKAGKNVKPGDTLQVRNPYGTMSQMFTFGDT